MSDQPNDADESVKIRKRIRRDAKHLRRDVTEEDPNNLLMIRDGSVVVDMNRMLPQSGDKGDGTMMLYERGTINPEEVEKVTFKPGHLAAETTSHQPTGKPFFNPLGNNSGPDAGVSTAPLLIDADRSDEELRAMGIQVDSYAYCEKCGKTHSGGCGTPESRILAIHDGVRIVHNPSLSYDVTVYDELVVENVRSLKDSESYITSVTTKHLRKLGKLT